MYKEFLQIRKKKARKRKTGRAVDLEGASPKWVSKRPIHTGGLPPLSLPCEAQHAANTGTAGPRGTAGREAAWTTRSASKTLKPAGCRCPAAGLQPSQPPGQRGHATEPPRDVQTELVRVPDCKVSGKTSRRHQSPSPNTRQQEEEQLSDGTPVTQKRTRAAESSASGHTLHSPLTQSFRPAVPPQVSRADRRLMNVSQTQDAAKLQKRGSGCTLTHSFPGETPAHSRLPPHACRAGRTLTEAKGSHGRRRGAAGVGRRGADFQPGSRESRRSVKEGREGKARVSGAGRKALGTRGGTVRAGTILMRAGPGGSTEQKRTDASVELSRGWPTPTGLWERAGTSCPRSPGLPPEKVHLPGPEVTRMVPALAFPGDTPGAKDPVLTLQAAAAKREGPEQQAERWPWAPRAPPLQQGSCLRTRTGDAPRDAARPRLEGKKPLMENVFREVETQQLQLPGRKGHLVDDQWIRGYFHGRQFYALPAAA